MREDYIFRDGSGFLRYLDYFRRVVIICKKIRIGIFTGLGSFVKGLFVMERGVFVIRFG